MSVGNKVLGLAVGQKSFLLAEVATKGGKYSVTQVGEFVIPEGLSLSAPDKLGQALQQFIKTCRFTTKNVIIGLPAKRLITRRKEVPPANLAVAASTLRLQAEGEFSSELDNLVMDYAGKPSVAQPTTVLLVATNRVLVDELESMAKSAGLRVHGITSTTAALGRATSRLPGGDGLVLNLGPNGAELVVQHGSDPTHLQHLNVVTGLNASQALAGEIRRSMASIPRNGTPQTLAIWNNGPSTDSQSVLEQRLSMPVTTPEVGSLVATDAPGADGFVQAVALALTALEPAGLPVDFLHSRLTPPKAPMVSAGKAALIAAGVILAGIIAYAFLDLGTLQDKYKEVDDFNTTSRRVAMTQQWQLQIDTLNLVKKWEPDAPHFVAVLSDLTRFFPPGPAQTVWATNLTNTKDKNTWQLQGKSVNENYPQQLAKDMLADSNKLFVAAKVLSIQKPTAANDPYYRFELLFQYADISANGPTASQPAARGSGLVRARPATAPQTPRPTTVPATATTTKP